MSSSEQNIYITVSGNTYQFQTKRHLLLTSTMNGLNQLLTDGWMWPSSRFVCASAQGSEIDIVKDC